VERSSEIRPPHPRARDPTSSLPSSAATVLHLLGWAPSSPAPLSPPVLHAPSSPSTRGGFIGLRRCSEEREPPRMRVCRAATAKCVRGCSDRGSRYSVFSFFIMQICSWMQRPLESVLYMFVRSITKEMNKNVTYFNHQNFESSFTLAMTHTHRTT
jgi:hypothetical protein